MEADENLLHPAESKRAPVQPLVDEIVDTSRCTSRELDTSCSQRRLDSIRNVCVLRRAMPYGWRQRERLVGAPRTVAPPTHTPLKTQRASEDEAEEKTSMRLELCSFTKSRSGVKGGRHKRTQEIRHQVTK